MATRVLRWLSGRARAPLPVQGLRGLRSVGATAYSLAGEAEELRSGDDWDAWAAPVPTQVFLVASWNAYALQATADRVLEHEQRLEPPLLGFAQACLRGVPTWIESARCAKVDPDYRPPVALPAELPGWPWIARPAVEHARLLGDVYETLAPAAEYEVARLRRTHELSELALDVEEMHTARDFADGLEASAATPEQFREVCGERFRALRTAHMLGQVAAMPSLLERIDLAEYRRKPSPKPPLSAIGRGWSVEDAAGVRVGLVDRVEGEPGLGVVRAIVVDTGTFAAARRATVDQIGSIGVGLVRLNVAGDALQPV